MKELSQVLTNATASIFRRKPAPESRPRRCLAHQRRRRVRDLPRRSW